jgi:hypothetical protein
VQFSRSSRHFIPLQSKYSPQHVVLIHTQFVLPLMTETKFHTHTEQRAIIFLYNQIFNFFEGRRRERRFLPEG